MNRKRGKLKWPTATVLVFTVFTVIVTTVVTAAAIGAANKKPAPTDSELYAAALADTLVAEKSEVKTLLRLNDETTIRTDSIGRVQLIVWHDANYTYKAGETIALDGTEAWAVTDHELIKFFSDNLEKVKKDEWEVRLLQLFGKPLKSGCTYFSTVYAYPSDIFRPAYQSDIARGDMVNEFSAAVDTTYRAWFDKTFVDKFLDKQELWTRLGYTYDWSPAAKTRQGLTEFVIREDASVLVESTTANNAFIDQMVSRANALKSEVSGG